VPQPRNLERVNPARAASGDKNEIIVHGEIGWSFFGEYVTATDVRSRLRDLADEDEVVVRINSPGGDASEGAAIYSMLRDAKQRVIVKIDGAAFSAASVIAMAGDEVRMSDVAMLMIHNAWTVTMGDSEEMRRAAGMLDKVNESLAASYAKKTGKAEAEILDLMRAETWMTAKDALADGFVDAIDGATGSPEPVVEDHHLERFRNAPKTIERFVKSKRSAIRIAASAHRHNLPAATRAPLERPEGVLLRPMTWSRK
jgi:ATP-dependent Clp protease, protease subunit